MIPLGEEHQKQQGEDIRDHQEQIRIDRRKSHSQAELVAAGPCDAEEDADEESRNDVPVAENHRGDGQIAVAKINTRRELGKQRVGEADAADTGQTAGNHNGDKTRLRNITAGRIDRLRILAAGTKAHAELRLIHEIPCIGRDDEDNDLERVDILPCISRDDEDNDLERVDICKYRADDRDLGNAGNTETRGYAERELIGSVPEKRCVDRRREECRQRDAQNIDDDTADDLIRAELDAEQRVDNRVDGASDEGEQHRDINN